MSELIAFVAGAVASALLWRAMAPQFDASTVLERQNYRGHTLPVAAGVVVVLAAVFVAGGYSLVVRLMGDSVDDIVRRSELASCVGVALGFGLIGLLDDFVGATSTKGFRGHLGALVHGRVSTGAVKLVWGVLIGVLAVPTEYWPDGSGSADWAVVRSGLLIAACANLANLFDRAPGRAIKVSLLGGAIVVAIGAPHAPLSGMMLVLGAGAGMLIPDVRERCMLGDTGSNVLGAAIGFGLVVAAGSSGEWIALGIVVALNVASEFVSFSKVIDAVAPLRFLDRLGALESRREHGRGD